jgi:metal-responsive CopG/Arc/MetJ family transcriptional regulator
MISFNVPWQLLNRIDTYVYEEALPSRTQFLIRAAEEALERANPSTSTAEDERGR